jgi:hypothetical protein
VSVSQQFPVDLPEAPAEPAHAFGWTAIILCIATLSLGLTNAASIDSWGADLPPSPLVAQFVDGADRWRETTDRAGLGAARATMHRLWKRLERARWPGRPSADPDQR